MAETIKYMGETSLSAYDEKIKELIATKANSSHTHTIANITNLQSTLDGKAASSHNHAASNITSGTLGVARGGTGAATFTSGAALIGNGTGAVTTRAITNMTSVNYITYNTNLMTTNTLAYWNGAYASGGSSNLTYCKHGAFGDMATKTASNYSLSTHRHDYITYKIAPITSTSGDTSSAWGAQENSVCWYTTAGQLNGQPSQYGFLLNYGFGSEVHQIWLAQSNGNMAHRGGNASGLATTWKVVLDDTNYTSYCAKASHTHNYAASSSAGGAATSANKLNTNAGSSTSPVYFANGIPVQCGTSLGVSITGNAATATTATTASQLSVAYGDGTYSTTIRRSGASPTFELSIVTNVNGTNKFTPLVLSTGAVSFPLLAAANTFTGINTFTNTVCMDYILPQGGSVGVCFGTQANTFRPSADNVLGLGHSNYRWTNVYAVNGTIKTSDENEKDILDSGITSDYENWYLNLKPILYKWKQFDWEEREHDRIHCGLGAQTTLKVAKENNLDEMSIAAICRDDLEEALPDGRTERYGIRYEELVSMNIHMIQKLYKENQELKQRIEKLESVA